MNREEAMLLLHDMKDTYDEIHENTNGDLGYEQMTALDMAIEALSDRPTDEWCTDCKEYDHEKHCCPRFNRVIRTTLNEVVRCKDCRHFTHYADGCGVCAEKDHILTYQNQNDFCSYGERREP